MLLAIHEQPAVFPAASKTSGGGVISKVAYNAGQLPFSHPRGQSISQSF